ncbi:MAG TPA: LysR substrate-binding domain-containing protein [Acetobacteraceae bacterium]|nr:LysR substrate-binding domain-containing protein [Acetobacteraceae bacterium]
MPQSACSDLARACDRALRSDYAATRWAAGAHSADVFQFVVRHHPGVHFIHTDRCGDRHGRRARVSGARVTGQHDHAAHPQGVQPAHHRLRADARHVGQPKQTHNFTITRDDHHRVAQPVQPGQQPVWRGTQSRNQPFDGISSKLRLRGNAGVRWFERLRNGYALTSAGEEALHIVERIETDVVTLDRTVTGQDLRLSGVVRITAIDMFAFWLLPDHLARFRVLYPGIGIEAVACNEILNLSRRETDIALRVGNTPPETLVGRRVGRLNVAIYGAPDLLAARPAASSSSCPACDRSSVRTRLPALCGWPRPALGSRYCPAPSPTRNPTWFALPSCPTRSASIFGC